MRVAVLVVVACAPAGTPAYQARDPLVEYRDRSNADHFAAHAASSTWFPWRVGQWAKYKRKHATDDGLETLRVIGQDGCGFWIEYTFEQRDTAWSWQFCIERPPEADELEPERLLGAAIERRDGRVVAVHDSRGTWKDRASYAWLVSLVHAGWAHHPDLPREDVVTPAGHFDGAFKISGRAPNGATATRWSHPAVVLGGIVHEVSGDEERILLDQGQTSMPMSLVDTTEALRLLEKQQNAPYSYWLALQYGIEAMGKLTDVSETRGLTSAAGIRVTSHLDVALHVAIIGSTPSPVDPMLVEDLLTILTGVRWYPYERPRRESFLVPLYIEGDVGYVQLFRQPTMAENTESVGVGIALGARIGSVLLQGHDWGVGLEAHDHIALLSSGEGLRHSFGVQGFFQFFFSPPRSARGYSRSAPR